MRKGIYRKLAQTNLKNNRKTYFPYILTAVITVMMFYMIHALSMGMGNIFESVRILLQLTYGIIAVFAVIFLFYTNSFLIRRRKKEIGVYHILGMGKRQIARVLWIENLFTSFFSIGGGLVLGILLGKLFYMLFLRILHQEGRMHFVVSGSSVLVTVILFLGIFFLTYLYNIIQIYRAKTIDLLHGAMESEKEPKTKWLLALIGVAALGTGYYIALTTQRPLEAFLKFFIAVLCVIIGTYALFTAGSIVILKALRKKKSYYYHKKHFTAVSGMLFRMKQNAVGLANICILSTMVLILVSVAVSMYTGMEDILQLRFPWEASVTVPDGTKETRDRILEIEKEVMDESGAAVVSRISYRTGSTSGSREGNRILAGQPGLYGNNLFELYLIPLSDYCEMEDREVLLKENEVLLYCTDSIEGEKEIFLNDEPYQVAEELSEMKVEPKNTRKFVSSWYVVMSSEEQIQELLNQISISDTVRSILSEEEIENLKKMDLIVSWDLEGSSKERAQAEHLLKEKLENISGAYFEGRELSREDFYQLYGCLFFIGIYLGIIFLMATVLIIYYKQISEGYDDRERYQIMQKVGMSKHEVRKSIRGQVLMVFYLPLLMAFVHVAAAFPLMVKLLALLNLTNDGLFLICTLAVGGIFTLFYMFVYSVTAREYYRIVN